MNLYLSAVSRRANSKSVPAGRRSRRGERGSVLAEFAAAAPIMFVVVALAVDAGYLLLGSWASDMACRDAARAAAQRATLSEARKAARAAIRSYQTAVVSPTITDNDVEQVMPTIGGQPDTSKCPYVKVTATANVHLPIPLSVGKVGFPATIAVARSYVFPIMESPTGS